MGVADGNGGVLAGCRASRVLVRFPFRTPPHYTTWMRSESRGGLIRSVDHATRRPAAAWLARAAAPAGFALVLLAACGGGGRSGTPAASPTQTASPPSTATEPASPTSSGTIVPPSTTPTATASAAATAAATATASHTVLPSPTATASVTATEGPSPLEQLLSVPERESWSVGGLLAPVHVVRTEANVPHIYAANRHDLAVVQGFVLARDRYVMMELSRRLSLGRLSELLGDAALGFDTESRGMGTAYVAQRVADGLTPELAEVVDAFATGINAYIAEVQAGHLPLPTELVVAAALLGAANPADLMQPVGRLDVAAMIATVVYQTSFDAGDLDRAAAAAQLDDLFDDDTPFAALRRRGARDDVFGTVGPTLPVSSTIGFGLEIGDRFEPGPVPSAAMRAGRPPAPAAEASHPAAAASLSRLAARVRAFEARLGRDRDRDFGSNAWAVAGRVSRDGSTLLAGDGHLPLSVPSVMFQLGLDTRALGGGDIHQLGLTIPGLPLMIVGTNGQVAWSQTQLFGDSTDVYGEEIELGPDGLPAASRFRGERRPLIRVNETYEIADVPALGSVGRTEVIPRWTMFDGRWLIDLEGREVTADAPAGDGEPVVYLSGRQVVPGDRDGDGVVRGVSLDYTGFDIVRMLDGPDGFGRSTNVAELREHTRSLIAFSQNIVAADAAGSIFYTVYHAIPCRTYLDRTPDGDWVPGANPLLLLDGTRYGGFTVPTIDGVADEAAGAINPARCVVPFAATPQAIDPTRGYVFTGNNDPAHVATDNSLADGPWHIGGPWDTGWRGARIEELLADTVAAGDADLARMSAIQGDHRSPLCEAFLPWLSEAVERARMLERVDRVLRPDEQRVVDGYVGEREAIDDALGRMESWRARGCEAGSGVATFYHQPDGDERHDAVATMLFNAWMARVVQGVWADEALPTGLFWRRDQSRVQLIKRFLEARDGLASAPSSELPETGESVFFDDRRTAEVETSREILIGALVDALRDLRAAPAAAGRGGFGSDDPEGWLWGLRHQVRFESLLQSFLGDDPLFAAFTALFAIDTRVLPLAESLPPTDPRAGLRWFPRPGDNWGVDAANPGFSGTDYTYADGPVMRMVFALRPGGVSGVNIVPGGQSGLTDSPHFADQAPLWLANETLPLRFALDDVIAGATAREVYRPR